MRKLILFLGIFLSFSAVGQVYQLMPQYGYNTYRMNFDSTLTIPTVCGVPTLKSNILRKSAIAFDTCNNRFYYYNSKLLTWDTIKGGGTQIDTTSLSNRINNKLSISDTSLMLTNYRKIDSLKRSTDSVFALKNNTWVFQYKDSVSNSSGFVPYTGATQDVDLGANKLSAHSVNVTGTNGNGHIHLKHQNADATATGQSTSLYANSNGDLKWKNDGNYYTTLKTQQTANRIYSFQNKSYTLADSSDVTLKLNISDTASMLSNYAKTSVVNLKVNISDTATFLTPYLRKIDTASLSTRIDNKIGISDTSVFQRKSISSYSFMANKTNASANVTAQSFRDSVYTLGAGEITWSGTTAPSGTKDETIRWVQVGNIVTVNITLYYSTAGSANTAVTVTFPSALPAPYIPSGMNAGLRMIAIGIGTFSTNYQQPGSTHRGGLRRNSGNTANEFFITTFSGSVAANWAQLTVTYFTN